MGVRKKKTKTENYQTHLSMNGVVAAFLLRRVALFLFLGVVVDIRGAIWRDRGHDNWGHAKKEEKRQAAGDGLTRHLSFGSLVINGLAGEGVDSDLGDGHRGILQLTVEPEHLGTFARVLHHLDEEETHKG